MHAPSPLLTALRERTQASHKRLDEGLGLTDDDLSLARYVGFLRGSLASLRSLEPALIGLAVLGAPNGTRCEAIEADLTALGASFDPPEASPPCIEHTARAMGAAYVVEGSGLGAAVLAKHVEPMLRREGASEALRYLRFHPQPSVPWREFTRRLSEWEQTASPDDWRAACDSADATFAAYTDAFREVGILRAERATPMNGAE